MGFFISVDPTTELILLIINILAPIPLAALIIFYFRSKNQLGRSFPKRILGINLNPSGVYATIDVKASKDTLDSADYESVTLARSKSIYKPKKGGGPSIAIIDPISDSTLNGRLSDYIAKMKEGKNAEQKMFNSMEEAFFEYYENKFLISYQGADAAWIDEEKKKIKAAKGILARKLRKITDESVVENGKNTQRRIQEYSVLSTMSAMEYDDLVATIQERLIEETRQIFPIEIDDETVTLNDIAKWESEPESVVVTHAQFERGRALERKRQRGEATKILLLGIVATAVFICGAIAYRIAVK